MHHAALSVRLPDELAAAAVLAALLPEAAQGPEGSTTAIHREGATLHGNVAAADLSALRAAINSLVRLMDAAQRTIA